MLGKNAGLKHLPSVYEVGLKDGKKRWFWNIYFLFTRETEKMGKNAGLKHLPSVY